MSDPFDSIKELAREARADMPPKRAKVYRCGDRTCGAPDCADCMGEEAAQQYADEQEGEE